MLTLELGVNCSSDGICQGDRYICELTVLDEAWAKKRSIDDTKCAERESNGQLEFIGMFHLIHYLILKYLN